MWQHTIGRILIIARYFGYPIIAHAVETNDQVPHLDAFGDGPQSTTR